ncbi:PDZ domain-containing protein [Sphingomonas morindae]|uniref:PDZ domain-containing protein n=1 Tax=Sphingomonas morindae TaxID=1541170 RepID=A0ABY4X8X7_9SPHN|nr:PDZ domain-containing protein [Sphingomonas morindae]USI73115.1 PDZ domain-containing protein [Sphingomonas morindae]
MGHRHGRGSARPTLWTAAICLVAALAIGLWTEHRLANRARPILSGPLVPGVTLVDDPAQMPVVTSLRSASEAEQRGVRVGDHIAAVDGRPVHSVAGIAAVLHARQRARQLALHIVRGNAVWTVAIDRAEPVDTLVTEVSNTAHDPQDPSD